MAGGFTVLDAKGRLSLPKAVRAELGIEPGSPVALLVIGGAIVVVPQDQHLAELSAEAERALTAAGIKLEDQLAELPSVRAEVVETMYGRAFAEELARRHQELRSPSPEE